ncbi:biotin--[acetyl-CoA-carboxylase] ligase [Cognatitamlana onchidii]|uniref:biotin--[acetyl-CoA-carboxylase] ligase n=1 Tax=Cognatitamlana onchidii TaxID=2562860 RepID=UPI0010A60E8E|nr:biotin--[acetyl-CoA-carboxylase] ligase [Algibacter onchidii]
MRIIKLSATKSTNSYLRELCTQENLDDYTVVIAGEQTEGRGQMGTQWQAQSNKNLTFSVFKSYGKMEIEGQFYISMVVALSILKTLQMLSISGLKVKWPNDILSAEKKICGVLIENVIKQRHISASVVGIGLNVNQTQFENLPKASSLKSITGIHYNLDELAILIIKRLKVYFDKLASGQFQEIKRAYESHLFRKNKPSTFKSSAGNTFVGFITGVSDSGKLEILEENQVTKLYDLKEVSLLY